jgi:ABC-2 type transport system ATP-binding protein
MITLHDIEKSYKDVQALKGVSFDVREGEFFGLLGPNGAGKSTLMNILSGYIKPDAGQMQAEDKPYDPFIVRQRRLCGLVPQNIALYETLTARANLEIFADIYELRGKARKQRIDDVLALVRLSDRADSIVKDFSGGMQRRLNLAASLLHNPKVLLCDEPTVGVDPQSRNAIFDFLQELNKQGLTVIYTTHYMEEAERLCDRIAIIDHGDIMALGTLEELLAKLDFEEEAVLPGIDQAARVRPQLEQLGEVRESDSRLCVRLPRGSKLSAFYAVLEEQGIAARDVRMRRPTLENLFLELTGRSLRE